MRRVACALGDLLWGFPLTRRAFRRSRSRRSRAARGRQRPHVWLAQHAIGPWHRRRTVRSIEDLSRNTANVALRVLRGESPRSIVTPTQAAGVPMFDWRELKRWDIDEDRLDPGSASAVSRAYDVATIPAANHCGRRAGERPGTDRDRAGGKSRQAAPRGEIAPPERRAVSAVVERRTGHDVDRGA